MWGLFQSKASCPVSQDERAWVEGRFSWLSREFGMERLTSLPVILPTPEFFPDPYHGKPEDVVPLFGRV